MTTVLVFGSFDPLHDGHRDLFRQARAFGDRLVVLVSRDVTIGNLKHRTSFQDERTRLDAVAREPLVDQAILGHESDYMAFLNDIVPDVICLGYDQRVLVEKLPGLLVERGLTIAIHRLQPHKPDIYKSSLLRPDGT